MTGGRREKLGHDETGALSTYLNAAEFDDAELKAGLTFGQGLYLMISGPAPGQGKCVRLLPRLDDLAPEYRRIDVVAETRPASDACHLEMATGRYKKSMPLSGITGTKGIEVVGLNGSRRFELS